MVSGSWKTTRSRNDPLRESLVKRARAREVIPLSENEWEIVGSPKLGDSRTSYLVTCHDDWWCECWTNLHGDLRSRRSCSHVTGAILWEQNNPDWVWEPAEVAAVETVEVVESPVNSHYVEVAGPRNPGAQGLEQSSSGPALNTSTFGGAPSTVPFPVEVAGPNDLPLNPDLFPTYRPSQWVAIQEVVDAFQSGYKVVFLSAPTGAGKTLVAESVRRVLGEKGIYTCTTKVLQDQVMRDFGGFAKLLKGRGNYPTFDNPDSDVTAGDCAKSREVLPACPSCPGFEKDGGSWRPSLASGVDDDPGNPSEQVHCVWCHPWSSCPYEVAKQEAASAPLAVLNTSYLLTESNYAAGVFAGWPLVVIDEADKLEEELMRFIEVSITPRIRKRLNIGLPKRKTVEDAWIDWLRFDVLKACDRVLVRAGIKPPVEVSDRRFVKQIRQLKNDVQYILESVPTGDGEMRPRLTQGWVYTGYEGKTRDEWITVTFKPVTVDGYARDILWDLSDQFLLMSATFVSPAQMATDLGLTDDEWTVVEMDSMFPPDQRPVIPRNVASVTAKTKGDAYPLVADALTNILDDHPNERVLVHTVSYEFTRYLYDSLRSDYRHRHRIFQYVSAKDRNQALTNYLESPNGVLLAPSFDRGVDLHQDDCRVIVIAKTPFPYLGDKQVSKRVYSTGRTGKTWYAVQTIRTICQMTGRGMRSVDDWCRTYILDSQFTRLYQQNRRLFPSWWSDAVVWDENDPKWRGIR